MAKHGLGRGLDALIKGGTPAQVTDPVGGGGGNSGGVMKVAIETVRPSALQPRKAFSADALQELSQSIEAHGIIQPLVVRAVHGTFELIAGERRLRAAGLAGLKEVPVIVVDVPDQNALELALIENVQREDLNIIEEAHGYEALANTFNLTQEQIASRVGKGRATVANAMRLLDLPDAVKDVIRNGALSAGHAKVILSLEQQADRLQVAKRCVDEGLSVRQLEQLVKRWRQAPRKSRVARVDMPKSHLDELSDQLHLHFGTAVHIEPTKTFANGKKGKGHIHIDFYSNDDLDRILSLLGISLD
ncbi:MAG: ParB/RepB/Spo0J family partition protein [Verrucomicrobia bacterium]|nr:ParB/RepB/Spo0J family partition protein [Verrucomicrobiota bacterium]